MPNRRAAIVMSESEIREYLESQQIINVATIGRTGHPHIVPMYYAFVDGELCYSTFAKSQKILNLRRDPKMSGLVQSGGGIYNEMRGVQLVGRGRIVEDYESVLAIDKSIAVRYHGEAAVSEPALAILRANARKRLGVALEVTSVVSWDHTKLPAEVR